MTPALYDEHKHFVLVLHLYLSALLHVGIRINPPLQIMQMGTFMLQLITSFLNLILIISDGESIA